MAAMANIKLQHVPQWAQKVPEEKWMNSLYANLTNKRDRGVTAIAHTVPITGSRESASQSLSDSTSAVVTQEQFADFDAHFSSAPH